MSLRGRTILLTRNAGASAEFISGAEVRGARVISFATIEISGPDSWDACDRALEVLDSFEFAAFTSAHGVERFLARCSERGVEVSRLQRLRIGAVGPATGRALERSGLTPDVVPRHASGRELASALRAADVKGKRVLIPQGDRARRDLVEGLLAAGARPEPVVVYRTVPAPAGAIEPLWSRVTRGEVDVAAFASPSAAEELAALLGTDRTREFPLRTRCAAIGPTTAAALSGLGWPAAIVARESTLAGLLDAIGSHFAGTTPPDADGRSTGTNPPAR